ncbi:MAG: FKBP-type peptidyl-prolyl cis-trans isomerase [Gemmatimonadaceae bacterium]
MRLAHIVIVGVALLSGCASQSKSPTAGMPVVSGEEVTHGGVRYVDMKVGEGAPVTPNACVYAHYTGWLANGTRFDTSREPAPGEPVAFRIGAGQVIRGWDVGFEGMRVGGRRRIYVPWRQGYGETGSPPVIPARADLVFDVEVHGALDAAGGARPCASWSSVRSR